MNYNLFQNWVWVLIRCIFKICLFWWPLSKGKVNKKPVFLLPFWKWTWIVRRIEVVGFLFSFYHLALLKWFIWLCSKKGRGFERFAGWGISFWVPKSHRWPCILGIGNFIWSGIHQILLSLQILKSVSGTVSERLDVAVVPLLFSSFHSHHLLVGMLHLL